MFEKLITKSTIFLLKRSNFSLKNKTIIVTELLDNLNAIQASNIISNDGVGNILINGKELDSDMARKLRDGAKIMLDSGTRKLIRDEVENRAIILGIQKGETPEQIYFSRAAIWWGQQEEEILKKLAQEE